MIMNEINKNGTICNQKCFIYDTRKILQQLRIIPASKYTISQNNCFPLSFFLSLFLRLSLSISLSFSLRRHSPCLALTVFNYPLHPSLALAARLQLRKFRTSPMSQCIVPLYFFLGLPSGLRPTIWRVKIYFVFLNQSVLFRCPTLRNICNSINPVSSMSLYSW